ncbi:MAG: energy transducer TonB [Myxococcaceae bacterium]
MSRTSHRGAELALSAVIHALVLLGLPAIAWWSPAQEPAERKPLVGLGEAQESRMRGEGLPGMPRPVPQAREEGSSLRVRLLEAVRESVAEEVPARASARASAAARPARAVPASTAALRAYARDARAAPAPGSPSPPSPGAALSLLTAAELAPAPGGEPPGAEPSPALSLAGTSSGEAAPRLGEEHRPSLQELQAALALLAAAERTLDAQTQPQAPSIEAALAFLETAERTLSPGAASPGAEAAPAKAAASLASAREARAAPAAPAEESELPPGEGLGEAAERAAAGGGYDPALLVQERIDFIARLLSPSVVRRAGTEGTALVSLSVNRLGYVQGIRVLHSTGSALLDGEVESTVHFAEPFPLWEGWLTVTVEYQRRE